ncbi:hypothetical protein C8R44DRAFT_651073 [Mycena epipterygia]|nr:hypothetical protein C8R44DRAFT_651073 [Mycena epipterygia]
MPDVDPPSPAHQPSPPSSPVPEISTTGRPVRARRPTWKLLQQLPELTPTTPAPITEDPFDSDATPPPTVSAYVWEGVKTVKNSFGLYREYPSIPTHNPEKHANSTALSNIPPPVGLADSIDTRLAPTTSSMAPASTAESASSFSPFKNSSIFGLMNWMWTGSAMKSIAEMDKLVSFLKSDQFTKEDLDGFNVAAETTKFDDFLDGKKPLGFDVNGWREVSVDIQVPDGKKHTSFDDIPVFSVPGLHFRPLTEVVKGVLQDQSSRFFHYTPFKHFWEPTGAAGPERVYDEIYSSDAFIAVHHKIQNQPAEPGCTLERVVLALMFWSDSTHLANFGTASLWPLYLFFGNQSKWVRGKPRAGACHHVAYMPKVRAFPLPNDLY